MLRFLAITLACVALEAHASIKPSLQFTVSVNDSMLSQTSKFMNTVYSKLDSRKLSMFESKYHIDVLINTYEYLMISTEKE